MISRIDGLWWDIISMLKILTVCVSIYICIGCGCLGNQVFGDHPCPFPQIDGSMYFSKIIGTTPGITSFYVDLWLCIVQGFADSNRLVIWVPCVFFFFYVFIFDTIWFTHLTACMYIYIQVLGWYHTSIYIYICRWMVVCIIPFTWHLHSCHRNCTCTMQVSNRLFQPLIWNRRSMAVETSGRCCQPYTISM